jgi:hypothetical protein
MSLTESPITKSRLLLGLCVLVLIAEPEAYADERSDCFDAASQGQILQDQHRLTEARSRFRVCAQQQCPSGMQADCAGWLDAVEKTVPTVVLSAKDGAQQDVFDATVMLDRQPFASKLDGQAIAVDPGPHTFRFERADGTVATEQVILREGEKARSIAVVLAPTPPVGNAMRTVGWVLGGIGVAAVAAGAALAAVGQGDRSGCDGSGGCPDSPTLDRYNSGTTLLNVGYGLLIGGGVVTLVGGLLWLASPTGAKPESARQAVVQVGIAPTGVMLSGGF